MGKPQMSVELLMQKSKLEPPVVSLVPPAQHETASRALQATEAIPWLPPPLKCGPPIASGTCPRS